MDLHDLIHRRRFLHLTGFAGALARASGQVRKGAAIALVVDPADSVASAPSAQWAARELQQALEGAGFSVRRRQRVQDVDAGEFYILAAASRATPAVPESLALIPVKAAGRSGLGVYGSDSRGLVYGLLELADRARLESDPAAALHLNQALRERPANPVRSVMRQFTCEPLDKPWFYDREMWPHFLTMLAAQRFNRFHLAFGLGYDSLQQVADSYFLFLYPFLLSPPGYSVRATNLPDAERDRNLDTLRFISEQTVARGMEFQLGIWMHGYQWPNSPRAQNAIEGLTKETHPSYCRDALTAVLRACPAISSVALRIHGESGIAEGSYDFWSTVFNGVKRCGRTVEIDLHAKGLDATMINAALATGMPVNVSPKFWAEHLGMPYHQASIRELEMPVAGRTGGGLMTLSEGARSFTRYGYADFLRDDRKHTVRHRVFSGTQRILLSGDPVAAAAYSRMFQFCGSTGADLMEPLTCRGRRGTGVPGNRSGYVDAKLEPRWDWEKYTYWYRVWGRQMYNPDTAPEVFRRQFGAGEKAAALQSALAHASRILPIVTTAHLPSAACDAYWPEVYWNQPMVSEPRGNPYGDTPSPKTFQNVSPLDPQLFSGMSEYADELLKRESSGKCSPVEVAFWLEDLARGAEAALSVAGAPESPDLRRLSVDIGLQARLGHFFSLKFRSGVLYAIHERTGDRRALASSLAMYRAAREAFAAVAEQAKGIYAADLSSGDRNSVRGQWLDRLAAIDQDISQMEQRLATAKPAGDAGVAYAVEVAFQEKPPTPVCRHAPPRGFRPGEAVEIVLGAPLEPGRKTPPAKTAGGIGTTVRLYYRHVNQAERFQSAEMEIRGNTYRAIIPGSYTDSPHPLQYYFELRASSEKAWLYPGFSSDLTNQPYIVLRRV